MQELENIKEALLKGNQAELSRLVQAGLDSGVKADDILNQGLLQGMDVVGERMQSGADGYAVDAGSACRLVKSAV